MKRITALLLITSMLLSLIIVGGVPGAAVDGDWDVIGAAPQYEADWEGGFTPVPGYEYTEEGLHMIPAEWSSTTPYGRIQTRSKVDLKEGIYVLIRVDDFTYAGDKWFNYFIWDSTKINHGVTDIERWGQGVQTLIRPSNAGANGEPGTVSGVSWFTGGFTSGGVSNMTADAEKKDADGKPLLALTVTWDGCTYSVDVNGAQAPQKVIDYMNNKWGGNESEAYIGLTLQNSNKGGTLEATVLKFGTSAENATIPYGDDCKEPESFDDYMVPETPTPLDVYVGADDLVNASVNVGRISGAKLSKDSSYVTFTNIADGHDGWMLGYTAGDKPSGKYAVIKYRYSEKNKTVATQMEIFSSTIYKGPTGPDNERFSVIADGKWHLAVIDLESCIGEYMVPDADHNYTIKYMRFDILNASHYVGDSVDITVDDDPDPEPQTSATVVIDSFESLAGETITVNVSLADNPGLASLVLKLSYDQSLLSLTNVEYNTSMGGQTVPPASLNGPVTLYWVNGFANYTGNGVFATLTFKVSENAKEGDTTDITISYNPDDVFNIKDENVNLNITAGKITVIDYVPGDINGDGVLNNKDVTRFMQYNAGWDVEVNEPALDVNGDGSVNNKDVTRLMQYNAGWDVEIH